MVKRFEATTFDDGDTQDFEAVPAADYDARCAEIAEMQVVIEDQKKKIAELQEEIRAWRNASARNPGSER